MGAGTQPPTHRYYVHRATSLPIPLPISLLHRTGTQTESTPYNLQYELRWDPNNAQYDISVNNWQVRIIHLSYLRGVITESLRYELHQSTAILNIWQKFHQFCGFLQIWRPD